MWGNSTHFHPCSWLTENGIGHAVNSRRQGGQTGWCQEMHFLLWQCGGSWLFLVNHSAASKCFFCIAWLIDSNYSGYPGPCPGGWGGRSYYQMRIYHISGLLFSIIGSFVSFTTANVSTLQLQPPPHVWFWVWMCGRYGHPARQDIQILHPN